MFRRGSLPSKLGERRRKRRIILLLSVPVLLLICIGGVALLSRLSAVTIQSVNVEGASVLSEEELISAVEEKITGNYFLLFPKRNIFLYPRDEIALYLREVFPRLKSAKLSFEDFKTLLLTVEERKPYALWCGVKTTEESGVQEQCSFLDETGFVFTKAPEFTGEVYLRYYGPLTAVTPREAGQFLSAAEFERLDAFLAALRPLSLSVTGAELLEEGDVAVYLVGGGRFFIKLSSDYAATVENLELSLASDAFRGKTISELDYLDLRFGNRVFFRFK